MRIGIFKILLSIGSPKMKTIKIFDFLVGSFIAFLLKNKINNAVTDKPIKKMLVIRPGGIGDAIFLLPLLQAIKQKTPDIKIDVLCEKRNAQIFMAHKDTCEHIFLYDQFFSFKQTLRQSYDLIIDTEQWHYLSALVSYFIKSDITAGFATRPLRTKLFNKTATYGLDTYELENFKNLFLPFFPEVDQITTIANTFSVNPEALAWANEKVQVPYFTLFLGASIALRRLTFEQSKAIIVEALKNKLTVVLLGGADVAAEGEKITLEINDKRLLNFTGKASLLQTAALIKLSQSFIGPDSGIMHLACAVGTPAAAIFGPGNVKKWGPQGVKDKTLILQFECAPCTHFGYTFPTRKGSYNCLNVLDINQIIKFMK